MFRRRMNDDLPTPVEADEQLPDDHVLGDLATRGIDLPERTLETLRSAGVPRLLRVVGWPGPALFHSELAGGQLISTSTPGGLIERHGDNEGYVLASVRQGPKTPPFSVFVLRRNKGDVFLLDARDPDQDRYVNASLDTFLASMLAFHGAFDHLMTESEEREKHVASFRALLLRIDPHALDDEQHYWPGWLEEMR